ncbi:transposase [Mycoplana dimorpha]|uniref:Transposase n=1 Tax=Mycoplana dimorpha TaxID=28320 RepID=A0A2T5AKA3_MYCDI|nr:transposase [Mycoplana dimorpha]
MKKQRFTEEQIIGVLKEQEAGAKAADLCCKHGISEATFYNWKGGEANPSASCLSYRVGDHLPSCKWAMNTSAGVL